MELATDPECAALIREEAARRIKVAELDIERLRDQLSRAMEAKERGDMAENGWEINGESFEVTQKR